jgi:hypothetical protein
MGIVKISDLPLVDSPVEGTDLFVVVQDNVTKKAYASDIQTYVGFEEFQTATAGQTVFNLTTMTYAAGANNLQVFVDGVNQYVGSSYLETDNNTVTFTQGLHEGALVKFATVQTLSTVDTSSANILFTQGDTGAVTRSVQSKLRDTVSVKDFGAVGDGVTDDTVAIQAAHDASVANGYFGILFPEGAYKFTTLTWSPHVNASTSGKVYLETAIASGRAIQISDEYGRPSRYGLNSISNVIWGGQFYVRNTNPSNTAIAWAFGGATNSYFCALSSMQGIETRGFGGGVYEFRYNAFALDFIQCFAQNNGGNQILVGPSATNSVTVTTFVDCRFGETLGYIFDIENTNSVAFNFTSCEFGYFAGFIKPGVSSPLTNIHVVGGNLEWNQVAHPCIENNVGATITFDGTQVAPTALSGWPTPVISQTTGTSTTNFINIKYILPSNSLPVLHDYVSAASKGVLDYAPNTQGGNALNSLVTFNASSIIGYTGITAREVAYTPPWSGTLGNGTIVGNYQRIGNKVSVWIKLVWGSTTSHAAAVQTFGLPYTSSATSGGGGTWYANDFGTGSKTGTVRIISGQTACTLFDDATATQVSDTVPMTWANQDSIELFFTYFV